MFETVNPRGSGLLQGGGLRHFRRRRSAIKGWGKNFSDMHLSEGARIKREVPDFDPDLEFEYTDRELILMAEKILLQDEREPNDHPAWINASMMRHRTRAEVYVSSGIPDPAIVEGLYWRTHPLGRAWTLDTRHSDGGHSFYK